MENDGYEKLRGELEKFDYPSIYMFKFIIKDSNQKLALIESLFGEEAQINIRQSSKGNFVSVTAKEMMMSSEAIINRYKEAAKIEGIMLL